MTRLFMFADEAGDFEFSKKPNVSKYFILVTIVMDNCDVGHALVQLQRDLAWQGLPLGDYFHAATDKQVVRNAVFAEICKHPFQIQATVMEKSKAQPQVRRDRPRFYQYGWYYHFRHRASKVLGAASEMLIVTASLGSKAERLTFEGAVKDVLSQTVPKLKHSANFCPAAADPCLPVADYCAWAIQRKWESGGKDQRSYDLVKDRITHEYDLWEKGTKHHY